MKCPRCFFDAGESESCPRCHAAVRGTSSTIQLEKPAIPAQPKAADCGDLQGQQAPTSAEVTSRAGVSAQSEVLRLHQKGAFDAEQGPFATEEIPPEPPKRRRASTPALAAAAAGLVAVAVTATLLVVGSHSETTSAAQRAASTSNAQPQQSGSDVSSARSTESSPAPAVAASTPAATPYAPASAPAVDSAADTPTRHARVLAPSGTTTVYGLAGPSLQMDASGELSVYPALSSPVSVGSYLDVVCTVYGQRADLGELGAGRVWDYTSEGWFTDQAMQTNSPAPVANACVGNINDPSEGATPPSPTEGPFPIYSGGESVAVYVDPTLTSATVETLADGDLVALTCSTEGDDVTSPANLQGQPIGHSTQWDRISSPVSGWVPDALVNSASEDSVAPPC